MGNDTIKTKDDKFNPADNAVTFQKWCAKCAPYEFCSYVGCIPPGHNITWILEVENGATPTE